MVIYLLMGWLVVVAISPLAKALPAAGLAWIVAGGLAYTIGVVFYALDKRISYGHGDLAFLCSDWQCLPLCYDFVRI